MRVLKKARPGDIVFSIITPSYNQGQFIEETIKSVLSQEGNFFIDYIIADGGSTDNSVEVIKKYDQLLKNGEYPVKCRGIEYRWWSREDKGQSNAINQGFKVAKGDILAWINSDDFYEPGAFAYVLRKFKETPDAALIYGDGYIIRQDSKVKVLAPSKPGSFEMLLREEISIYQPSAFFTKDVVQEVGFLDENLHYAMDYDLWLRIFADGRRCLYYSKPLASLRLWEGSKTSPQQEDALFDRKKVRVNKGSSEQDKSYSFEGKIRDSEYLLRKHDRWLREYPVAYASHLRHLATMNLLAGNKKRSRYYFTQSIKVQPSLRNILTFLLSLFGKSFYRLLLNLKRKAVKDIIHSS